MSRLDKKYKKLLKNKDIKLISFDIFDTLFFRKCGAPENIFLKMGKKKLIRNIFYDEYSFKNYRIESEKKAYKNTQKEEVTLEEIYSFLPLTKVQKEEILKLELKLEKKELFINKQMLKWIKLTKKYNKKVILTSDMYLSKNQVSYVALKKIEIKSLIDEVYMSSEIGLKKSTGRLFEYILKENHLKAKEVLHIGDNINSDINVANAIGISTIYYNYDKQFLQTLENEKIYLKEHFIEKDYLRLLPYLSNPYKNEEKKFFYNLGATIFGPILWEFSIWLKHVKKNEKIEQLNFFMREGYTFEKVYKMIFPKDKTKTVEISRQSTNFLTLDLNDLGEINFNKFKELKVKDFYNIYLLNIKNEQIKKQEDKSFKSLNSLELENIIEDIKSRKNEIKQKKEEQSKLLKKYLQNLNINNTSSFIDFGGGGTVIERINNLLYKSSNKKTDILFFMSKEAIQKSSNNKVVSFLPNNKIGEDVIEKIRRTPYFIEFLLNGYNHSTKKYKQKNQIIKTIQEKVKYSNKNLAQDLKAFYDGVEAFIKNTSKYNDKESIYKNEYIALLLSRVITVPTQQEVSFLGALEHDEGNGSKDKCCLVNKFLTNINYKELYLDHLNNPLKTKNKYLWLEGQITYKIPNLIKRFYGITQSQNETAVQRIIKQLDEKKLQQVSIYGAGEIFEMLIPHLKERNIKIKHVFDSRAKIKPFDFLGYEVIDFDNTKLKSDDTIVIASVVFYDEIKKILEKYLLQTV